MREARIERAVCRRARENGWLVYKFNSAANRGVPDRIMFRKLDRKGRVLMIEFKAPGRKATKLQAHTIEQMRRQGAEVHIIDNLESGYAIVA